MVFYKFKSRVRASGSDEFAKAQLNGVRIMGDAVLKRQISQILNTANSER